MPCDALHRTAFLCCGSDRRRWPLGQITARPEGWHFWRAGTVVGLTAAGAAVAGAALELVFPSIRMEGNAN